MEWYENEYYNLRNLLQQEHYVNISTSDTSMVAYKQFECPQQTCAFGEGKQCIDIIE